MTLISRRQFIDYAALSVGGLCIAIPINESSALTVGPHRYSLNTAYIKFLAQGPIVFIMPKVEMGQGIYTGLAMLIAEELGVRLDQIVVEPAPPLPAIYGVDGDQSTGGSTSVRDCWERLRHAGATVRQWLLESAAHAWQVAPDSCVSQDGLITHSQSQRHISYQDCALLAQHRPMPQHVALKKPNEFRLIGSRQPRIDSPSKVDGSACFGIDVRLPNQVYARLALAPTVGGRVANFKEAAALAIAGVLKIVNEQDVVAVIATNSFSAQKALDAMEIEWLIGPHGSIQQADLLHALQNAINTKPGAVAHAPSHAPKVRLPGRTVSADYVQPLLAHATMEPLNATVHIEGSRVSIWTGTQAPDRLVQHIATLGFKPDQITLHNHLIGGGFGRRLDVDFVEVAVRIARHFPKPVQVTYSREQDIQHDRYRPCYWDHLEATLDDSGTPIHWVHKIAGGSASVPWDGKALPNGVDGDAVEAAANLPYALPNVDVRYLRVEPKVVPISWWRGVGPTRSVLVVESFMDELAHATHSDPIEYRLRWLKDPRARTCLETVKAKARWHEPLPPNYGRGVSIHAEFGSYLAQVVEVRVVDAEVKVIKVTSVMDCGIVINPDQVFAQLEGGSIFGITATLYGKISIKDGAVEQSNFHDYRLLRLSEAPRFENVLVPSDAKPGGVGETATACVQAAVLNAVFNACRQRIRVLPIELTTA